ncbi:MAG: response regulator [Microcoleaceae cyanobacterium]
MSASPSQIGVTALSELTVPTAHQIIPAKILVVDDKVEFQNLIQHRFRSNIRAGEFDFVFASDGIEALETIEQSDQIDVVLTDINMPKMDGLTLLDELNKLDRIVKAIVLSAYGDLPNIRTAMNRGAFDFLTKPIDFQDLKITLKKSISAVREIREQQYQLQQTQARLQCHAVRDSLTNLPNRVYFLSLLQRNIFHAQRHPDYFICGFILGFRSFQTSE